MTATLAPRTWPAPASPSSGPRGRFARDFDGGMGHGLQWVLTRNCSITPRQLLQVYLSLCMASLLIAAGFWLHGAPAVMAFAGIELVAVGAALAVYARHATDRETITLADGVLAVEHQCGSAIERAHFRAEWVRVAPMAGQGSLLAVSGEGRHVLVGRYVRPELRAELAGELRGALRAVRAAGQ